MVCPLSKNRALNMNMYPSFNPFRGVKLILLKTENNTGNCLVVQVETTLLCCKVPGTRDDGAIKGGRVSLFFFKT